MVTRQIIFAAIAVMMALSVTNASAQTVEVLGNVTLQSYSINTPVSIYTNEPILKAGFNGPEFNLSLGDTNPTIIGSSALTSGNYVVELRGTTTGDYGGTLSLKSHVPEPDNWLLMISGIGLIGFIVYRSKSV